MLLSFQTQVTVILEIMMRKSGSGTIKALIPEKYKQFVQGVIEVVFPSLPFPQLSNFRF